MYTMPIHPAAPTVAGLRSPLGQAFDEIECAFGRHGGLLRGNELALRMRQVFDQPISRLARSIVNREVIAIAWRSEMLLPMFQFDPLTYALRPGCAEVLAELHDLMDDWNIAYWFATPCPWLWGNSPVDMIESCWREVFQAARTVRFALKA